MIRLVLICWIWSVYVFAICLGLHGIERLNSFLSG